MNVLVTGSLGRIGRYVVTDLVDAGHTVCGIDLQPSTDKTSPYLGVDLTDAGQVYQAIGWAKPDAVVHMAAWPDAGKVADTRTYGDNVLGTYNLFKACADMGVKRVVSASTNQIYGFAGAPPIYAPVDEEHPLRPINSYALSKIAGETAADFFVQNHDMTILSFRLMGIRTPDVLPKEIEAMQADPTRGAGLLWTRTDVRDAAMACRMAIEARTIASGPYNITGAQVLLRETTAELVERYFGDRTEVREQLAGHISPLSCQKARQAFGYEPKYVWRWNQAHRE